MPLTGQTLRQARESAGLTQEAVADRLGRSRVTIVHWEQRAQVPDDKAEGYLRVVSELANLRRVPRDAA